MRRLTDQVEYEDETISDQNTFESSVLFKQTTNRWLGNDRLISKYVKKFITDKKSISVLDVGTGAGDIPRFLTAELRRWGISAAITCLDRDPKVLELAENLCKDYSQIDFVCTNDIPDSATPYTLAIFSQILHHFSPAEAAARLKKVYGRVTDAIIISDLVRSRIAYWLIKIAISLMTTNPVSRHDGPLSVLRSYDDREIAQILSAADITDYEIHNWFPRKIVVIFKLPRKTR